MRNNNYGKVPPQATDLENAVLGAILLDKEAFHTVNAIITSDSFYNDNHQLIYKSITALVNQSRPIDILTVTEKLRADQNLDKVGGTIYLMELLDKVSSSANVETHAAIIQQFYLSRKLIETCQRAIDQCYDGTEDVFKLFDDTQSSLNILTERSVGRSAIDLNDIISERIKHYETKTVDGLTGLTSGYNAVDQITAGWQPSDLVIIAGRPGMGKTAFMLALARNAAVIGNVAVAIFSLEMSKEQLTDRLISSETGIPQDKLKRRDLQAADFQKIQSMNKLINSTIFIDDTPRISIDSLRSKCMRLKRKNNIGLIVVDYLQLMKGEKETRNNREQEISSISQGLKAIAKEINVPVIALSQLSRKVDERPKSDRRPLLSDLRESGSIEQDADQVVFLFRPEYYGIMQDEDGNNLEGLAEIMFAKNRNGALDTVPLRFNGSKMQWSEFNEIIPF